MGNPGWMSAVGFYLRPSVLSWSGATVNKRMKSPSRYAVQRRDCVILIEYTASMPCGALTLMIFSHFKHLSRYN